MSDIYDLTESQWREAQDSYGTSEADLSYDWKIAAKLHSFVDFAELPELARAEIPWAECNECSAQVILKYLRDFMPGLYICTQCDAQGISYITTRGERIARKGKK